MADNESVGHRLDHIFIFTREGNEAMGCDVYG
jgi:hypothetical protein